MPTIDVNETTLYYERSGDGPAMLFVHGAFGDADSWAGQAQRFGDRYTVVRYDRRGYRRSSAGTAPISYAQHTDDAAALIRELDLAPCLVVGLSSGAAIGLELALRHSHLLRGAVLSEPPLFSLDPGAGQALLGTVVPRVEQAIAAGGPRAAVDAFLSLTCASFWSMIEEEAKDGFRANAEPGLADVQAPLLVITPADVAAVAVPTLVIAGSQSPPGLRSVARILAAALPDARFVELDGSGHVTHLEKPDEFAAAVAAFAVEIQIDRHTASTGARRSPSRLVTAPPRR